MTSRREFLKAGGALVLLFSIESVGQTAAPRLPGSMNTNRMLNAWLRIDADGSVTIFTGKIELGQGIGTALAQIAADELDVDLKRVHMIHGDTALTPNEGQTAGSLSVENSGAAIRYACAEARAMLLSAAAAKLGTQDLKVVDGTINEALTYGQLAGELDLKKEATASVKPKPPSEHRYVGKSIPRRDIPKKFTGGEAYVQDIRLPGMLFGRVVRPPSPGATLASVDLNPAKKIPGVVAVVRDGDFLAVAAEREEQAIKARAALVRSAVWKESATLPPSGAALYDHMQSLEVPAQVMVNKTAADAAPAAKTLEARYTRPFQAHGSIGPSCAVAQWTEGKLRVWTHSQGVFPLRGDLANVFGLELSAVRCTHAEGAGCYGHNGADDVALDAALLARAAPGRPVRLQWMRDDEFAWEPYGAAMSMSARASLDADNKIADWHYELWSNTHSMRPQSTKGANVLAAWYLAEPQPHGPPQGIPQPAGGGDRNSVPLYDFPNQKIVHHFIPEMPIRVSALRTLGAYANVFAMESFMDEMAALANADPVAFRLAHMKDPRARAVIEKVAAMASWRPNETGNLSRGRGIGFSKYKNLACYVACIAEVEVDRASGKVRVSQVWSAVDSGLVINPDGLKSQIEGGIIQSASWTLHEQVRFDRNGITSRDWASYPIMTMPEVPKVTVELINRPTERALGAGEGSQGPAVAAIANAVAHATGKRLRDLPLDARRVKTAIG
jgi:nicotinate dehydrogenase subunit B